MDAPDWLLCALQQRKAAKAGIVKPPKHCWFPSGQVEQGGWWERIDESGADVKGFVSNRLGFVGSPELVIIHMDQRRAGVQRSEMWAESDPEMLQFWRTERSSCPKQETTEAEKSRYLTGGRGRKRSLRHLVNSLTAFSEEDRSTVSQKCPSREVGGRLG